MKNSFLSFLKPLMPINCKAVKK